MSIIDFYAKCRCGWKYGPGLQSDVVEQSKHHRKTCKPSERLEYADHCMGLLFERKHCCPLCEEDKTAV